MGNQVGNDRGTQYRHGIYWHSEERRAVAEESLQAQALLGPQIFTEVKAAEQFWDAEDYHMQYLQKGGQDARKQATDTIRCYGGLIIIFRQYNKVKQRQSGKIYGYVSNQRRTMQPDGA